MQPWRVRLVRTLSAAKQLLLFVDTACDGALFRLARFSPTLGLRRVVPEIQPFSQMGAEVLTMARGLRLIFNVDCPVAHCFWKMRRLPSCRRVFALVGNLFVQRVFRRLYVLNKGFRGRIYLHWVRGALNPAHPPSRLCTDCDGDRLTALELARARLRALWAAPACNSVMVGLPFGPFVLPHAWWSGIRSASNPEGREFRDVFLEYRVNTDGPVL